MNINIEVIHSKPSRRCFRELMARSNVPDYVLFNEKIKDEFIPLHNTNLRDVRSVIKLNADPYINWDNVAIPRSMFYNLSVLHLREYPKGVAHYIVTQNEHPIVLSLKIPDSEGIPDINPYMKTLYKIFYSNLHELTEVPGV